MPRNNLMEKKKGKQNVGEKFENTKNTEQTCFIQKQTSVYATLTEFHTNAQFTEMLTNPLCWALVIT